MPIAEACKHQSCFQLFAILLIKYILRVFLFIFKYDIGSGAGPGFNLDS